MIHIDPRKSGVEGSTTIKEAKALEESRGKPLLSLSPSIELKRTAVPCQARGKNELTQGLVVPSTLTTRREK